jgi:hypothetical protein
MQTMVDDADGASLQTTVDDTDSIMQMTINNTDNN